MDRVRLYYLATDLLQQHFTVTRPVPLVKQHQSPPLETMDLHCTIFGLLC